MKNQYLEAAIYSFKKAISEYNNLFEPERLNQFFTNILQAFNRIFIFYCIDKGLEYKTSKRKIKSLEDLMKPLKTNGKMTESDWFLLKKLKEIRNNFQHDKYDPTEINNAFIFVSALVSLFKKLLKEISPKTIKTVDKFNLVGINEYQWIDSESDFSKKLFKFYNDKSMQNYSYEISKISSVKGFFSNKKMVKYIENDIEIKCKKYTQDDGQKATEMVASITYEYKEFKMHIFTNIKAVLGIVSKDFKKIIYKEIPKFKINDRYVLRFKNLITYKKELEIFIKKMIEKNTLPVVKEFFKEKYKNKKIVKPEKIIKNRYNLNFNNF